MVLNQQQLNLKREDIVRKRSKTAHIAQLCCFGSAQPLLLVCAANKDFFKFYWHKKNEVVGIVTKDLILGLLQGGLHRDY